MTICTTTKEQEEIRRETFGLDPFDSEGILDQYAANLAGEPEVKKTDIGEKTYTTETWPLPYNGRPNSSMVKALQSTMGPNIPLWLRLGWDEEEVSPDTVFPEPRKVYEILTIDDPSKPRHQERCVRMHTGETNKPVTIVLKDVTADQAEQLVALSRALR